MTSRRNEVTDEELAEVLRRGRFEDLSLLTVIAGFAILAALAVALQLGAPQNVLLPIMVVVFAITFLAMWS